MKVCRGVHWTPESNRRYILINIKYVNVAK